MRRSIPFDRTEKRVGVAAPEAACASTSRVQRTSRIAPAVVVCGRAPVISR
jgi:hypothetical protein